MTQARSTRKVSSTRRPDQGHDHFRRENIYSAEVEKVLHEHPAVQDCAVVGVPDAKWGEVGRAVIVLRDGASTDQQEILDFLGGRLAKYKIPKTIITVDALEHNATGKLRRREIKHNYGAP